MIVLGIDPGIRDTAWAEIDCSSRRPRFVAKGMCPSDQIRTVAECRADRMVAYELAAIEQPTEPGEGWGKAKTVQARRRLVRDLMITALVAGEALGCVILAGAQPMYVTRSAVRRALCGKATATDADVKRVLGLMVDDLPKRSNNHVRDAIATAIVGARMKGTG